MNKKIAKGQNPTRSSAESSFGHPSFSALDGQGRGDVDELNYDTKTLITILMLVAVYPVGLVLMLVWMKWNKWIKILVALPVLFMLLIPIFIFLVLVMVAARVVFQPNESIKTFDMVREKVEKEMVISPTGVASPTGKMASPTVIKYRK